MKHARRPYLVITTLLVACGCTAKLDAIKPQVALPQRFSGGGAAKLGARWWRSFNDPELTRLVERALSKSFSLRAAWARVAQARAVAKREGAALYPSLSVQASGGGLISRGRVIASTSLVNVSPFDITGREDISLGLAASYELDLWGKLRSTRDAAKLDLRASEHDLMAAAISLSAEVAIAWYRRVEQAAQLALLETQLRTNERTLELVTVSWQRGAVRAEDVFRQRQLTEAVRAQKATVQAALAVQSHRLAVLVGAVPTAVVAPAGAKTLVKLPPLPRTGVPSKLITRRPDLARLHARVLAADRRFAAAVADRLPSLSLSAGILTSGRAVDLFASWIGNLAASIFAPILDGGRRKAESERFKAQRLELRQQYTQQVLEALREVEDALIREVKQRQLLRSIATQLKLAKHVIERVHDSYVNGVGDYLRVLDAYATYQQLQRNELTARRELIEIRIGLCRALSGGWKLEAPRAEGKRS
ncbi:MAG: efflux transporter outer membrane subunit [Myxococcales bacterium]|nr:efflux transporter outer membrane subunit [Myxococcales bacterium]